MNDPTAIPERDDARVLASMANERTIMAWQRTALGWGAAGAVIVRFHATDGLINAGTAVGVAMLVCGALLALAGVVRYHQRDRSLRAGSAAPELITAMRVVSIAMTLTVAAAIVVELRGL